MEKSPPAFVQENNASKCSSDEVHRLSIAPMIDVTETHFRIMFRLLSRKVTLYTDMIHCDTILNSVYTDSKLRLYPIEKPVVLQLGGSDPTNLAKAARIGEEYGYDEINLNCGCPSPRVTKGSFGACLMKEPGLVAECVRSMEAAVSVPVTVKCRLGVDDLDDYAFLYRFMDELKRTTNCKHVIIHARKAYLKGLNPKQNRNIPPLIYERVYQAAKDFPGIRVSINGGIRTLAHARQILTDQPELLGVMMGRAAYQTPWIFGDVDREVFGAPNQCLSRKDILRRYGEFADHVLSINKHFKIPTMVRPLLGLFAREKGFRVMKRFLSEKKNYKDEKSFAAFMEKLIEVMEQVNSEALNFKYDKEGIAKLEQKRREQEKWKKERERKKLEEAKAKAMEKKSEEKKEANEANKVDEPEKNGEEQLGKKELENGKQKVSVSLKKVKVSSN